jgi:protein SCO1/2
MRRLLLVVAAFLAGGSLAAAALVARPEPTPAATSGGRGGAVWGADYFPDVPLVAHDGRRVRFFSDLVRDKVVLINFIYTSCPDTCPMETARLLDVQRILGDRVGEDVFLYSITIDPENDTQPVLAKFADDWDIPEGWLFLTGELDDITLLRKKLGVSVEDVTSADFAQHDLALVMGNQATGRWMKRSPFENPYVLANQLGSWLHNWKLASAEKRDFADAPELRQISTGEDLFRTRCASCHTIGRGDLGDVAARRIGPDLYHVGRQRDPEWLTRWLREPDAMIEEGDPLAVALLAQYKGVPMPNFRLTDREISMLLLHIDQESRRVEEVRARRAPQASGQVARHDGHAGHGAHAGHAGQDERAGHGGHGEGGLAP